MIITVTSIKWGVWKSTISQNIAVSFAHKGYKTVIIDTDKNNSSVHRCGLRDETLPHIAVYNISDNTALVKNIKTLQNDFDLVVIDGTPDVSMLVSTMLILWDIIIIPIQPSAMDIRPTKTFLEHYEQARVLKDDIHAWFLFNQYDEHTNLAKEARQVLEEWKIPILKNSLKHRVAYAEATIRGKGVTEYEKDPKAIAEMNTLTTELMTIIQKKFISLPPSSHVKE